MTNFVREDLVTVYQILSTVERPNRVRRLTNGLFGPTDFDARVQAYAQQALKQCLSNAGLRKEGDHASVFERIYDLLDRIETAKGVKIKASEKTRCLKFIDPSRYHYIGCIPRCLNLTNSPSEPGSFELSEIVYGVMNVMIARQSLSGGAPEPIQPLIEAVRSKEDFDVGYPYDLLVHDVTSVASNPGKSGVIFLKPDYLSTQIALDPEGKDASTVSFCRSNGFDWEFKLSA